MTMTSHELAKILLENEDMLVATHANNHTYAEKGLWGKNEFRVAILKKKFHSDSERFIIIGNVTRKEINAPNEVVVDEIYGRIPDNWS